MKNFRAAAATGYPMSPVTRNKSAANGANHAQNIMALLEARILNLEEILGIDGSGDINIDVDNINIRARNRLTIESDNKMKLKTQSEFAVESTSVDIRANSGITLRSSAMTFTATSNLSLESNSVGSFTATSSLDLSSSGVATLDGATTRLGKGVLPVATAASVGVSAGGISLGATLPSPHVLA